MPSLIIKTPAGPLLLTELNGQLAETRFTSPDETAEDDSDLLQQAKSQLEEYFAGHRRHFDLPLLPAPTPFQERIRRAMLEIPYGQTRRYGELAHSAGGALRAIGQACGANSLPIIVPCHRVVAAQGLGGYSGGSGLATKRLLIALERNGATG